MLLHTVLVRASMSAGESVKRFWVLRPSVKRMMTCRVSAGGGGGLSGTPGVSACQPQTSPMVWLVMPFATIWSILAFNAVQSLESVINGTGHPRLGTSAGKYVDGSLVGAVFSTS